MEPKEKHMEADVQCPFFKKYTARTLTCEGITDGSNIDLNFPALTERVKQMEIFCCESFENCEIWEAVMKAKYMDDLLET